MQYSTKKGHQHHKWQQQMSWRSYPDCQGAEDKQPQYLLVEIENAPELLKIPKSECPDIWIRLRRHKWPKSWSSMEVLVLLERNLYGHPLAGLLWKRQFGKILLKYGWEKVSNWECLFEHRQKRRLERVRDRVPRNFVMESLRKRRRSEGEGVSFLCHHQQRWSRCVYQEVAVLAAVSVATRSLEQDTDMTNASVERGDRKRCKERPTVPESADSSSSSNSSRCQSTPQWDKWMGAQFFLKILRQKVAIEVDAPNGENLLNIQFHYCLLDYDVTLVEGTKSKQVRFCSWCSSVSSTKTGA